MNFRTRALAYAGAGAVGLVAAGAFAAPALAAPTDADVSVVPASTKIAAEAVLKFFRFDIKNAGPGVATGTTVAFDLSGLDPDKIDLDIFGEVEGEDLKVTEASATELVLEIGDGEPGETLPFDLPILLKEGAEVGPAGSFTVTVETTANDPDKSNNSTAIPVEVVASGPDLTTYAFDVHAIDDEFNVTGPVPPGGTAPLLWLVFNQGDRPTKGLKMSLALPKHVSFVEDYDGCVATADRRVLTCEDPDLVLEPGDVFGAEAYTLVKVAEDAPGPVTLDGGLVSASAASTVTSPLTSAQVDATVRDDFVVMTADEVIAEVKAAVELPAEVKEEVEEELSDVDEGDNSADFAVFVGAVDSGGGGGGLPVTGVQAGLISGVGLAVLAGGGALFLLARRRRIVLVTPGDETPTA